MAKNVLVTGGAGYIGSHTLVALVEAGYEPIVVDNYSNSSPTSLERVRSLSGAEIPSYELDLVDTNELDTVFERHDIDSVIHFAGLKAVGESVEKPLLYYKNNLGSTFTLLEAMDRHSVRKLVFSSTGTVYSPEADVPFTEDSELGPINPYSQTKLMIEQILSDLAQTGDWQFSLLRYFNPIGAHPSGEIGEDPTGIPNNLLPYINQVAIGKLKQLSVFGDDYDTTDGTGIRDYIHVMDLADAHIAALSKLPEPGQTDAYNIGSGSGTSVLELIAAFEEASGKTIPYEVTDRRPGDMTATYANADKAAKQLGWSTKRSVADACADSWNWQQQNPNGFRSE